MEPRKRFSKLVLCVPAALFLLLISLPLYAGSSKLLVKPDLVRIRALYNGTRVNVSAEILRGCDVIVEITGGDMEETVVQKVRRLGLWMNGREIVVRGAPSIYLAMSSEPAMLTRPGVADLWGYKVLKKRVSFSGHIKDTETDRIFKEFLELKESLHLYGVFPGALEVSPSSGARSTIRGSFKLPSNVTPGSYRVSLSVVQKGEMLFRETVPLKVLMVGFPELVYRMAKKHAVAYGFLAIAIAALAGLFVGLVFARSRVQKERE